MRKLLMTLILALAGHVSQAQCPKVVEVAANFGGNNCAVAIFEGDIPESDIPLLLFEDGTSVGPGYILSGIDSSSFAELDAMQAFVLSLQIFYVNELFFKVDSFLSQYMGETAAFYSKAGTSQPETVMCLYTEIETPIDPIPYDGLLTSMENDMPKQCLYSDGLLPVVLTSFGVVNNPSSITVQWSTSFEYENSHFAIQRSADGIAWHDIGSVPGKANYDGLTEYQFVDKFPISGINFYRLADVDFEGKRKFSELRQVKFESQATAFPNPASSSLTVKGEFHLFDSFGRLMRRGVDEEFDVSDYPDGIYIVKTQNSAEKVVIHH